MNNLLEDCRTNFGPAPRKFAADKKYLYPGLPRWMAQDKLEPLRTQRHTLLKRGRIVWSALVQANRALYQPIASDLPGLVVWSQDPALSADTQRLRNLATDIFELKSGGEGELKELGALIRAERERPLNFPVPPSLAPESFVTTVLFFRDHLPGGFLTRGLLPLLVLPEETPFSMILPGRFWPDALKDQ